jgi:hypothetical protein
LAACGKGREDDEEEEEEEEEEDVRLCHSRWPFLSVLSIFSGGPSVPTAQIRDLLMHLSHGAWYIREPYTSKVCPKCNTQRSN